jgi:hypothetical protein
MSEFSPENAGTRKKREQIFEKLPEIIDKKGTLFAYGFLLDCSNLKNLLKESRSGKVVKVHEARSIKEASDLAKNNPDELVILRSFELGGVRRQIMTNKQFIQAQNKKFGESPYENGPQNEQYLYIRPAGEDEKERKVSGGLILGFTSEDLKVIDKDEAVNVEKNDGIYFRKVVPELEMKGIKFKPEHIEFYGGNAGNIHQYLNPENPYESGKEARKSILDAKREPGKFPESAKWPHK